jgi:hypothetical protein
MISPLVRIDKIINSVAGCEMMALLDCFSEYHQIWLRIEDMLHHPFQHILLPSDA